MVEPDIGELQGEADSVLALRLQLRTIRNRRYRRARQNRWHSGTIWHRLTRPRVNPFPINRMRYRPCQTVPSLDTVVVPQGLEPCHTLARRTA